MDDEPKKQQKTRKSAWRSPFTWITAAVSVVGGGGIIYVLLNGFHEGSHVPAIKNPSGVAERQVERGPHAWEHDLAATTPNRPWWDIGYQMGWPLSPNAISIGIRDDAEVEFGLVAAQRADPETQMAAIRAAVNFCDNANSDGDSYPPKGIIAAVSGNLDPSFRLRLYAYMATNWDSSFVLQVVEGAIAAGKRESLDSLLSPLAYNNSLDYDTLQDVRGVLFKVAECDGAKYAKMLVHVAKNAVSDSEGATDDINALTEAQQIEDGASPLSCRLTVVRVPAEQSLGIASLPV